MVTAALADQPSDTGNDQRGTAGLGQHHCDVPVEEPELVTLAGPVPVRHPQDGTSCPEGGVMDPDSITAAVLTALAAAGAAGATSGVQDAASDTVKRAYDRLRDRLRARWRRQGGAGDLDERVEDAEKLIEKFRREPDDWASDLGYRRQRWAF